MTTWRVCLLACSGRRWTSGKQACARNHACFHGTRTNKNAPPGHHLVQQSRSEPESKQRYHLASRLLQSPEVTSDDQLLFFFCPATQWRRDQEEEEESKDMFAYKNEVVELREDKVSQTSL
ncbi:small integral membrane protein 24 isoform X2 [Vanacampus margaritifer]